MPTEDSDGVRGKHLCSDEIAARLYRAAADENSDGTSRAGLCPRCRTKLVAGKAMIDTEFGCFSSNKATLQDCWKCPDCGESLTLNDRRAPKPEAAA